MKTLRLAVIALAFTAIQSWASTTTPRLGMTIPAYGDQNWDVQLRSNFNIIDSSVSVTTNTAVLTSTQAFTGTNTFAKIIFDQNGTSNGSGIYFTSSAGTPYSSLSRGAGLGIQDLRINPADGLGIGTNNPYSGSGLQGQPYFIVGSPGGNFGTYGRFAVLGSSADSTVTYSGFTSTNSVNTSTLWVLPRNDGTANQPLATDGAANLSFASSLTLSSFTVTTSTSTRFNSTVSSITSITAQNFTAVTSTSSRINSTTIVVTTLTPTGIVGTTTNDIANPGNYGQYISTVSVGTKSFPVSGSFGDLLQMDLSAGDWDVSVILSATANGATFGELFCGVGSTSGNSIAGMTDGDSYTWSIGPNSGSTHDQGCTIPSYRISLAATTTYYLKFRGTYTVATPLARGRMSARRVR